MKMKFFGFCNACMHVLLAISRTCSHDDVSRLVAEHACCSHVACYFTHLLHIGLLGLFPSTASLDAVCSVFHVLAAALPSESYCFMCSKSEANATNSNEFELACGGDFARCRQPRKKTTVRNLYFDCYLSHFNHITWDIFVQPWAWFVSLRKRVFRTPSRNSCAFYLL